MPRCLLILQKIAAHADRRGRRMVETETVPNEALMHRLAELVAVLCRRDRM